MGAAFSIATETHVDGIGGHFGDVASAPVSGSLFGAIVNLNSSGLPSGTPLVLDDVIASTVFVPVPGSDFLTPMSVTLAPGTYGFVFGAGLFGATGEHVLSIVGVVPLISDGTVFASSTSQNWFDLFAGPQGALPSDVNRVRLLVSGEAVAAVSRTSTLLIFLAGFPAMLAVVRRRRNIDLSENPASTV